MTAKNVISPSSVEFKMIPPLNNGDHLSRVEFERRYEAYPDVKAELIEGVVYMLSPVRVKQHGKPHSRIMVWLGTYQAHTTGVDFADNATLRVGGSNVRFISSPSTRFGKP